MTKPKTAAPVLDLSGDDAPGLLTSRASLVVSANAKRATVEIRAPRGVEVPPASEWTEGLLARADGLVKGLYPEGTGFFVSDEPGHLLYTRKIKAPGREI